MLVRFGEKVGERVAHVLRVTHACKGAQADSVPEPAAARLHTRVFRLLCGSPAISATWHAVVFSTRYQRKSERLPTRLGVM